MMLCHLRLYIIFSQLSTLAMGPTQPPIKWVPWFCLDSNAANVWCWPPPSIWHRG